MISEIYSLNQTTINKHQKYIPIMITQEPITLDKIRNDQVKGFECSFWEDMGLWNVQYLGDGHQDFFKTIEEAQEWLITWQECGE
jgi:hypothetical protein